MPFISEAASAIKSRLGFHNRSDSVSSVQKTPALLKSVSKDNLNSSQFTVATSAIRKIGDFCDDDSHSSSELIRTTTQSFDFSEDPSFWKEHNVQVIIRIRPLSSSEISVQGHNKCIRQESSQMITWTGQPESRFTFDHVADESVSQEKLFKVAGVPMVENCVVGYNSCIFAYGQTGSGKTYTMLGDIEGGTRRHSVHCGMTPRVFEYLFSRIQKEKDARTDEKLRFTCKCSFLEIYNEQILDLLDPSSNNLQIREDAKKGVYVENLKEMEVSCARDVIQQLIQGAANRKVAATNMNRASSRSHSVFTCVIESKWESQGVSHHRFARLNLVDLAGSERQKSSGAEGERLKEATNINKSLSTLGLVIMNLVNISNGKSMHVPYRDSKLTFLLQDSLGGNAKTMMIANISPSSICSLETLSTLKFAQRAKFIKNNAIINEDASGDVIAMRMQIQQLKKEVSRLRGLTNGGAESQENDMLVQSFQGSPGPFKEGLQGSFSPLVGKRMSHSQKDYEVALVGAFRREKDKDIMIKALEAENQAAMQLAKQREDEIQSLKMRLRLREAGIKRLGAVASGKVSADTHLLQEKEEHLKEIEILRAQVDRNQEVTRFAMENLQLKEEIRRLKTFYEEGERELMNEQITALQNKLLEALDWKWMHGSDSLVLQKEKSNEDEEENGDLLSSNQEPGSPRRSLTTEENEFLRTQAIHNQSEINSLNKQLHMLTEEKEKLERLVNELETRLEEEKSSRTKTELPAVTADASAVNLNDQMGLKTMVDAIAAASQREAEAHEKAIILSRENEELHSKLESYIEENMEQQSKIKALIEEKNSLIELYEQSSQFSGLKNQNKVGETEENDDFHNGDHSTELANLHDAEMKVKILEQQLMEMHEENDKLMGLYEQAMRERDEFKRMLSSYGENNTRSRSGPDCPERLVEVDEGNRYRSCIPTIDNNTNCSSECIEYQAESVEVDAKEISDPMEIQHERPSTMETPQVAESDSPVEQTAFPGFNAHQEFGLLDENDKADAGNRDYLGMISDAGRNTASFKQETAQKSPSDSTETTTSFHPLEKAFIEFDKLFRETEEAEKVLQFKRDELGSLKTRSDEIQKRKGFINQKLSAVRNSLSYFSLSSDYFEKQEARARARLDSSSSYLQKRTEELISLQALKCEQDNSLEKLQQSDTELRSNLVTLKSKLEAENQRLENEKVLFVRDNIENVDVTQKNWLSGGKATELLKSEEEKTKLQSEIKLTREKLRFLRGEQEELFKKSQKLRSQIQIVETEIQKGQKSVAEIELSLQKVIQENETLSEMKQTGRSEFESAIIEYQQHVFEADLKDAEMEIVEEELTTESKRFADLKAARGTAAERMIFESKDFDSFLLSEKLRKHLGIARALCS